MKSLVEYLTESSVLTTSEMSIEEFLLWYFRIEDVKDFSEDDIAASIHIDDSLKTPKEAFDIIKKHFKDEVEFSIRRVNSEEFNYSWKLEGKYFSATYYGDDPMY